MNIILVGLGGNGVVTAGRILAETAAKNGFPVKIGEEHGVAQRGGTVMSHLRFGEDAKGVIIPRQKADVILGFEPLETLRQLPFLRPGGYTIMNPRPVFSFDFYENNGYPSVSDITVKIRARAQLSLVDATDIAGKIGSSKYINIVMLGALAACGCLPLNRSDLLETVVKSVPLHTIEVNKKAFCAGEDAIS